MMTPEKRKKIVDGLESAGFTEEKLQTIGILANQLQTVVQGATMGDCMIAAITLLHVQPTTKK